MVVRIDKLGARGFRAQSYYNFNTNINKYIFLQELRNNSEFKYDWSYIVAWIGVGLSLMSAILLRYKYIFVVVLTITIPCTGRSNIHKITYEDH